MFQIIHLAASSKVFESFDDPLHLAVRLETHIHTLALVKIKNETVLVLVQRPAYDRIAAEHQYDGLAQCVHGDHMMLGHAKVAALIQLILKVLDHVHIPEHGTAQLKQADRDRLVVLAQQVAVEHLQAL